MWILLYHFHTIDACRKMLSDYTNLLPLNDYKKNDKIIYKYFKINMIEEASLEFRLSKKDKRTNYLLDEIKQNI